MSNLEIKTQSNKPAESPIIDIETVKKNINNLDKKYSSRFDISLKDVQNNPDIKEKKDKLDQDIKKYQDNKATLDKEQKKYQDLQSEIIKLEISKKTEDSLYTQKKTENSPESQKIANSTNIKIEKLSKDIDTKNEELKTINTKKLEDATEDDIKNIYKSLSAYQDTLLSKYQEKIKIVDSQLDNIYTTELNWQYDQIVVDIKKEDDSIKWFADDTDTITKTNQKNENIKKESKKIDKNYESIKQSQIKKMDLYTQWIAIKFYKSRIESAKITLYRDIYMDLSTQFANIDKSILWVQKNYYQSQKDYFGDKEVEFKWASLYKLAWDSKVKKDEYDVKISQAEQNPEKSKINQVISNTQNIWNYMNSLTKYIEWTTNQNIYMSLNDYQVSEKTYQELISKQNTDKITTATNNYENTLTIYRVFADNAKQFAESWDYKKAEELQKKYNEEKDKLSIYSSEIQYYTNKKIDLLENIEKISLKIKQLSFPLQRFQSYTKEAFEKVKSDYTKIQDNTKIEKQDPICSQEVFETNVQKDIKETLPKPKEEENLKEVKEKLKNKD